MTTATRVDHVPAIDRHEAATIATTEYQRVADQLRELDAADWQRPTDCPDWDVRAMAGHTLGMMRDFSSLPGVMRRTRAATKAAKAAGGPVIDSMTAMQVADTAALTTEQLVAETAATGPVTAQWRTKSHPVFRRLPV